MRKVTFSRPYLTNTKNKSMRSINLLSRSIVISFSLIILLLTAMGLKPRPIITKSGQIKGRITYEGKIPPPKKVSDKKISDAGIGPVFYQDLIVNNKGLANVFVHITALKGKNYAVSSKKKVIEMQGYQFSPRVTGVMVNQTLIFKNSDGKLHNVHGLPKVNKGFNIGMPPGKTHTTQFTSAEGPFKFTSDMHPWMNGYVAVMTHPYFAVSDKNGNFSINTAGLEPGTYTVQAWHEKLGTRTGTAKVTADDVVVNLKF